MTLGRGTRHFFFLFAITSTPVRLQAAAPAHLQSTRLITHSLRNKETGNVNQPCLAITVGPHTSLRQTQLQLKAANLFWEARCVCAYLLKLFWGFNVAVGTCGCFRCDVGARWECVSHERSTCRRIRVQPYVSFTPTDHPLLVSHSHPLCFFFLSRLFFSRLHSQYSFRTFYLSVFETTSPCLSLQLSKPVFLPLSFFS